MKWTKNRKILNADIDFEIVGQYPSMYYFNEVEVIGRLKPFNKDLEFDNAETVRVNV